MKETIDQLITRFSLAPGRSTPPARPEFRPSHPIPCRPPAPSASSHAVLYAPGPTPDTQSPQTGLEIFGPITPKTVTLTLLQDLPHWDTDDFRAITERMNEDEENSYKESLQWALGRLTGPWSGQLLGHSEGIGRDPRRAAAKWEQNPDTKPNRELWRNLLCLRSKGEFSIGDAGFFTFLIRHEDLARKDFSRTFVNLESS